MSDSISIGWYGPSNDYWGWILGHFRDVTLLTDRNVGDWLAFQSHPSNHVGPTSALLIAIDSRVEPEIGLMKRIEQNVAPGIGTVRTVPTAVVLGDDWVGHRRTYPLPETLLTFYWYELYDRLLPWLGEHSKANLEMQAMEMQAAGNKRKVSPRVQRLIDTSLSIESRLGCIANAGQLAMVVSETAATRQLWCETLARHEIRSVATTPQNLSLWAEPDFILVDLEMEPLLVRNQYAISKDVSPKEKLIEKLARRFPASILLVTDAFPRWANWQNLYRSGADILVAKPFQLTGILETLIRFGIKMED
jgi:CheY-like chemotaxis protein